MAFSSGRVLGAIVPFAYRSSLAMASISQTTRVIPKHLETITKKIGIPLPASASLTPHQLPTQKPIKRINTKKLSIPAIHHIHKRSFGSSSKQNSSSSPPLQEGVKKFTGLAACVYDCLKGSIPAKEVDFYHHLINDKDEVLVIGSGTGRLLLALEQRGIKVEGIEPSPAMREICMNKALLNQQKVNVYSQHMENFQLDTKYDSIFVPEETFMYILDKNVALETLKNFSSHLKPGGQLVIELLFPSKTYRRGATESFREYVYNEQDGTSVSCEVDYKWSFRNQYKKEKRTIVTSQHGEPLQSQTDLTYLRFYSPFEFLRLLKEAGFIDVDIRRSIDLLTKEIKVAFQAKKAVDLFDNFSAPV